MAYTPARCYHSLTDCRQMPLNYLISCLFFFRFVRTPKMDKWLKKKHIPRNTTRRSNKFTVIMLSSFQKFQPKSSMYLSLFSYKLHAPSTSLSLVYSWYESSVAARFKSWVCSRSLAGIVVSNLADVWMSFSCECFVLSGRGICDGPIPRPEEP